MLREAAQPYPSPTGQNSAEHLLPSLLTQQVSERKWQPSAFSFTKTKDNLKKQNNVGSAGTLQARPVLLGFNYPQITPQG